MPSPVITSSEYLEISSIPLRTPAWKVRNLYVLMTGADVRGSAGRILPGVSGEKSFRQRVTASTRTLELVIMGSHDQYGTPYADAHVGLEANLAYLRANLLADVTASPWTRAAVLHLAGGGTLSAAVKVIGPLQPGVTYRGSMLATLDLRIPAGAFT